MHNSEIKTLRTKTLDILCKVLDDTAIAQNIENAAFQHCMDECDESTKDVAIQFLKIYRPKMRTIISNLQNKNNNLLKMSILTNKITPKDLCKMSAKEMYPDAPHWKTLQERERLILEKEIEEKKRLEKEIKQLEMEGSLEKCGKCGSRHVAHFGKQTRSADESMTFYFTCRNCGNRWKKN